MKHPKQYCRGEAVPKDELAPTRESMASGRRPSERRSSRPRLRHRRVEALRAEFIRGCLRPWLDNPSRRDIVRRVGGERRHWRRADGEKHRVKRLDGKAAVPPE